MPFGNIKFVCATFSFLSSRKVFFQDDTKDKVAGKAVAANATQVADAVRCMPLPVSRMPAYAVPVGQERCSVTEESVSEDFTIFLTRQCLSVDQVRAFTAFGTR